MHNRLSKAGASAYVHAMLWFVLAALTGATLLCILWPLRGSRAAAARPSGEIAILRGQIEGVSADMSQGVVAPGAAEAARAELGRRLIAAKQREEAGAAAPGVAPPRRRRALAAGLAAVCVPLLAFGVYSRVGAPGYLEAPAAPAPAAAAGDMEAMLAQVEAHLAKHPDDGRGYEVLAPVYLRQGRAGDAAQAWASAIRLLGASAERQSNYGEALFAAAGNIVSAEARAAFEAAAALDGKSGKARFYLALAAEQEGDKGKAKALWTALAADAPAGAPWLAAAQERLASLDAPPALAAMPPAQLALVRQMVEGLATRLARDGHDLEGWQKLVRAYTVLAELDKARDALRSARAALAADTTAMAALDALARDLGLDG